MNATWIALSGAFALASAQDKAVPDLFRPDPKLTFLETRGQLLPSEAKHVALRVEAIDTFELRARPVRPQDIGSGEEDSPRRTSDPAPWTFRMRLVRPRDSLTTWTAWLDLETIARKFPGMFLEVEAVAGPGAYRPSIKESNCDSTWSMGRFLVTKLGLVGAEIEDRSIVLQAVDLETMSPWPGVEVRSLDKPFRDGVADSLGQVLLPATNPSRWLATPPGKSGPIAIFRSGGGQGISEVESIRLGPGDRLAQSLEDGIRLFPYTQRNFHRPGDTLVVGCVVRGPGGRIPSGRRINLAITDPWSHRIDSVWRTVDSTGHLQWRWPIGKNATTGSYQASIRIGKSMREIGFLVEETKIPRILMETWLSKSGDDSFPRRLEIRSRWNTGRPANRLPLQVRWIFRGSATGQGTSRKFGGFPWNTSAVCDTSSDGTLDADGSASLPIPFPPADRCGYTGGLTAQVSVLEDGGHATSQSIHSPSFPWREGPGMRLDFSDTLIRVATTWLDTSGRHVSGIPLDLHLTWGPETLAVLRKASGDTWALPISVLKRRVTDTLLRYTLSLGACAAGTSICVGSPLNANVQYKDRFAWEPDWTYFGSPSTARNLFYLESHPDSSPRRLREGDSLEIHWESSSGGLAWIHAIQGSRILRRDLRLQRAGTNRWKVPTDSTWFPGVDVAVFRMQLPQAGPASWAELDSRHFQILRAHDSFQVRIESDSVFHPRTNARIGIVNPTHRQGVFVLSAIDQGVLDLAPLAAPDPRAAFETPESSELHWWDAMGWRNRLYAREEFSHCSTEPILFEGHGSGTRQGRMAIGAGGSGNGVALRGKASVKLPPRFLAEPLTWISRPLPLPPDRVDLSVPIPAFLGQVRLRVVASAGRDVYVGDTSIHSRAAVEANLSTPQFLSPGDTTIALFRSWSASRGKGIVRIQTWGSLTTPDSIRTVRFDSSGTSAVRSTLVAGPEPGSAWVEATIRQGSDSIGIPNRLEIKDDRNWSSVFQSRTSHDGRIAFALDKGFSDSLRQCRVEVSAGGILGLDRLRSDLLAYPHGCLEQTISTAMPQLFLARLFPAMDQAARRKASSHVDDAIAHLPRFANPSGLLSLWPGTGEDHPFASLWAARFLREAQASGHVVPSELQMRLEAALRNIRFPDPTEEIRRLAFSAPQGKDMPGHRTTTDSLSLDSLSRLPLSREARWILASAWHLRGDTGLAKLQVARIGSIPDSLSPRSRRGMGSRLRNRAWALEAMAALSDRHPADSLIELLGRDLETSPWLSTQEEGSLLLALAKASKPSTDGEVTKLRWQMSDGKWQSISLVDGRASWAIARRADSLHLRTVGQTGTFRAQLQQSGIRPSPEVRRDSGFTVQLKLVRHDSASAWSALREGTMFEWEIRIRNISGQNLTDIAATAWLPAGWTVRSELSSGRKVGFKFVEVRADRVVHHLDLDDGREKVLRIPLRATQEGSYLGPEVSVEALYDNALRAKWKGERARIAP